MAWLRYDVVMRTIPTGVRDVLEVGCGRGAFGARIASSYNYLGLEPDEASCAVAAARVAAVGSGEVRNVMTDTLGDEEKFDMVCAFEVLEHIEDDFGAVKEWASHIRPGGWMLLSVPADQHRYGPKDEHVGHFRRYSPELLTSVISEAGLSDVTVRRYSFPLGTLLEGARDVLASRKLATANVAEASVQERSAASGRQWQPSGSLFGTVNRVGTVPFRGIQRMFPGKGAGLVALGRLAG
jgi:cyclopropane fatty-acyl-phospholipid synthase-like methyltransferase